MSETSQDRSAVIGAAPTGSRATDGSSATVPPAEESAPAPGPRVTRARPDGGAASALHRDISRALADLRLARHRAVGSTAPELAHDVDLAEWRLNKLLERT
jgi:hypothetical protein